ncbi:MAG: metallophosphoesterase [Lachnospiraceae bacterium]|nr:metallophosphoesterase [Lachnospiraceae bacterium]
MKRFVKKKKVLSLILCILFTLIFVLPVYAKREGEGQDLRAREDGSFRILLIADTQDRDNPQKLTIDLLNAELDAADADLVIFLGDMIYGPYVGADRNKVEAAIRAIIEPVVERNLPFAVVFGNHDDEDCLSKEEQLAIYQSYPGCLNEDPDIPGVGNTCLPLYNGNDKSPAILLWLIDSGTYVEEGEPGKYAYVKEEQNQWFREGIASYGADQPVSYVFQHIPVPQVFTLVEDAKAFSKGAFCTFGNLFSDWYREVEGAVREGRFGETPCPPEVDSGQFQSWKDCNVKAAFFGHDHTNDYVATIEGIDVVATCGLGFYSYGRGDEHGTRLLVLHTDKPEEYDTKMVFYKDLIDKPLNLFQTPTLGAQLGKILFLVIAGVIVLIVVIIILVHARKKKKKIKTKR